MQVTVGLHAHTVSVVITMSSIHFFGGDIGMNGRLGSVDTDVSYNGNRHSVSFMAFTSSLDMQACISTCSDIGTLNSLPCMINIQ